MEKVYCKWCGESFICENELLNSKCLKNPEGKHEICEGYEGGAGKWTCKFCATTTVCTLQTFVNLPCLKSSSGYHVPL